IIMANVPPNDPNVDAPPIAPAHVNLDHAPAQPMEKFMSERIDTEGRIKKKFKEQDRHFLGLGFDNIEMDRTVRKVMSNLSRLKKDAAIADATIATSGIDDD
nr:hypothetical protein [Tanacetum cinerariifolium]